jgi:hypothetical protein
MASTEEILCPKWVPPAAQKRIVELWDAIGIDENGRALLRRLATEDKMKTEVWAKLPSKPQGFEGQIIDSAFGAFTYFPLLPRPFPKTTRGWREWAKHSANNPPLPDPAHVANSVYLLCEGIVKLKLATDAHWPRFWEGDRSITSYDVLAMLVQLHSFYLRMDAENRAVLKKLPKVKRWDDKAAQKFFNEFLSQRLVETYGRPLDSIVAALTEVAFDVEFVASETVRGRRRLLLHRKN